MDTKTSSVSEKFDFQVAKEPIFVLGSEVGGKKAIVRQDTGKVLGIVSDKYEVIEHGAVIDGFRQALGESTAFGEKISITKGGAHLFATYTLKHRTVEVKKGDIVGFQFTVKNSYDGTNMLQLTLGAMRLVCLNGMVMSRRFFGYSQRHYGENAGMASQEAIGEAIASLALQFDKQVPFMQAMAARELDKSTHVLRGALFESSKEELNLPEYLCTAAFDEYAKAGDGSLWGYYNAITFAITHNMRRESPQAQLQYGRIAWERAVAILNEK